MKSILDPSFKYTPSASTDIRKTFARVRREQRRALAQEYTTTQPAKLLPFIPTRKVGT